MEARGDRSMSQRCHDGITLGLKAGIASGELGSQRGHAVTVVVRTTLGELNQVAHAVEELLRGSVGPPCDETVDSAGPEPPTRGYDSNAPDIVVGRLPTR